jgi:hypothetical protein
MKREVKIRQKAKEEKEILRKRVKERQSSY